MNYPNKNKSKILTNYGGLLANENRIPPAVPDTLQTTDSISRDDRFQNIITQQFGSTGIYALLNISVLYLIATIVIIIAVLSYFNTINQSSNYNILEKNGIESNIIADTGGETRPKTALIF